MLNFMRQNANSWVMIVLFAVIIFVFAINFGPWAGNSITSAPYAAVVNSEAIPMNEFRTAYTHQFARIKQFRPDYDQTQADKDGLKQMVIDQLVSRELLTQVGQKNHFYISAKTLAEEIKDRVFGKDGEFNKEEYIRRINSYFQTSIGNFEQQVAKEMVAEQVANLVSTSVFVSDAEAKMAYIDRNTKVAIEFIKINPEYFKSVQKPSTEDIKQYVDKNGQKILDYYNEHISDYVKEAQVKASHILVKVPQGTSPEEKAKLKDKAEKILARVKDHEDFAHVANNESDDVGTKSKGGDLGYFTEGMMVEPFSKAAFALKPGEISDVVESPFGFHIIKQIDQKPKMEHKLEDVKLEIAEVLVKKDEKHQKAKDLATLALEQLKSGTPLAKITLSGATLVKASGTPPKDATAPIADETESFAIASQFIRKLGRAENISAEAFKLTKEKPTAEGIIEANDAFFAIRLKSREDADMTKFDEEKDSIKTSMEMMRKRALLQQFLSELKETSKIKYNETLVSSPTADT